jgi:hypothetical protein
MPQGTVVADRDHVLPDGTIEMKFPWWRGSAAHGELSIEGRRLDASAPSLQADIPAGYGEDGFQATGLLFPTVGCWEITARSGGAQLTVVQKVVIATG